MLVLGDSVVWGQGLKEEKKFHSIVREQIRGELPTSRDLREVFRAHSGATILPEEKLCPIEPGEVPITTPTIFAELQSALSDYYSFGVKEEEINLVLLNGGINDVTFPVIVNPFTSDKSLIKLSQKYLGAAGMQPLLNTLLKTFPNALVCLTGYFPIISTETDPNLLLHLLLAFFGQQGSAKILKKAAKRQAELQKKAVKNTAQTSQPNWLIGRLSELSALWKRESDADLLNTVRTIGNPRVLFVPVEFASAECYAAPRTNFWRITGSGGGVGNLVSDDSMFELRQQICPKVNKDLEPLGRLTCVPAGAGHPNELGAAKYANAIIDALHRSDAYRRLIGSAGRVSP
jgi:hypothetical protein